MSSRVGDDVTIFTEGEMPIGGIITEIGLGAVRIAWSDSKTGRQAAGWFHNLEPGCRKPGMMMGDPLGRMRYEPR